MEGRYVDIKVVDNTKDSKNDVTKDSEDIIFRYPVSSLFSLVDYKIVKE